MKRRSLLPGLAGIPLVTRSSFGQAADTPVSGKLRQSVTAGVFRGRQMTLDDMCRESAKLGIYGFDLVNPTDWPILKKYGLKPTMLPPPYGGVIKDGIIRKENHDRLEKSITEGIRIAAAGGCPNVITLAGSRHGMPDDEGAANAVAFLNKIKSRAEDSGVTVCLELLNSKINHPDYMCDHTAWGVNVMKQVGSPRVKLLYDIYHMQIMEGDIVRTIRDNRPYIAHFHTGGNPGRHEIDETQELNYRFIAQAIAELGFDGVIAHEYTPVKDPLQSLRKAVEICRV